ncbi:PH domain-containing protein [Nocardiopsis algeriensis]|uniref:YdbS-like PH domain-containing protein n=1 Tax=Nocardiopsis algeriensis TaxID=1478215 RepID=A0A841IQX5_9ACTN|nr:hypothetical protein [Nocardiopsis algeriensis]
MTNSPQHEQIEPNEVPHAGTARLRPPEHRVSRSAVGVWTVRLLLTGAVNTVLLSAVAWGVRVLPFAWIPVWAREHAWVLPVVYGVYALLKVAVVPSWRYRVHRWEASGDVIYTRAGWVSRSWQLVPVNRLQTVDHTQGWLERLFGVATLKVQTASYAGSSTIEGLDAEEARRMSEELAVRAAALQGDAT